MIEKLARTIADALLSDRETDGPSTPVAPEPAARADSREARMVVVARDEAGTPTIWCDPEIADLVQALNDGGIATVASCSGHGHRPGGIALADGRELIVAKDYDEARAIDRLLPSINGEPAHARAIGEFITGEDVRSAIKDALSSYLAACRDYVKHPGPCADELILSLRALADKGRRDA